MVVNLLWYVTRYFLANRVVKKGTFKGTLYSPLKVLLYDWI